MNAFFIFHYSLAAVPLFQPVEAGAVLGRWLGVVLGQAGSGVGIGNLLLLLGRRASGLDDLLFVKV